MIRSQRVGTILALAVVIALGLIDPVAACAMGDPPPLPGMCYERDRFGFWVTEGTSISACRVGQLHGGWYVTPWPSAYPPHPGGLRFAQLVRVSEDGPQVDSACSACPTWSALRTMVQNNPGSLWLIGNEPDRQDYVTASRYAELYHDLYTFLKTEDPTCQVAVGGVVQPTPIRLQYLDMILDAYESRYSEKMPVDVWNVHNYVLREGATGWGCGIPPGADPALAIEYGLQDHDDLSYWTEHIISMRAWMRDRGYRDRPLIISEFGILMPDIYGYPYARVRDFMLSTFDWLTTATDAETGYPADGNRLVQVWLWYSLDDAAFEYYQTWSHLCDPDSYKTTDLGWTFGGYAAPLTTPFAGTVDLYPEAVWQSAMQPGADGRATVTVKAQVHNGGAEVAEGIVVRFLRQGTAAGEVTIPVLGAGASADAHVVWADLWPGSYEVQVAVNPDAEIAECNHGNNSLSVDLMLGRNLVYLPLVERR